MTFGLSPLLLLLVAVPVVAGALLWLARWRRGAVRRLVAGVTPSVPGARWRRPLKAMLALSALALIALAAALPRRGERRVLLPRQGTDVMVVMDVSASMLATDVEPNRLERAKTSLGALLDRLQGDRVGMVVFAGSAGLKFPLTTDAAAAREQIRTTSIREGALDPGTGIGEGIRRGVEFLPKDDPARARVLIIVSDGEDLAGNPAEAVRVAHDGGAIVYTLGVGTEAGGQIIAPGRSGTPTPRLDPTTNQPATTRRDEGLLRSLAAEGKGRYIDGNDATAGGQLADEVGRLARSRFESQEGTIPTERFRPFAAAALVLLTLDFLIAEGRRMRNRRTSAARDERSSGRAA